MTSTVILGVPVPKTAGSQEFGSFVKLVYGAAGTNYLHAGKALRTDSMTVWRIVNGKQKDSPSLRKEWGIEYKTKPAPVCTNPACKGYGEPHVFDCQTQAVIEKPAPKAPRPKRKRRPRISADVSEEQRDALHKYAASHGGRSWSEFCRWLADKQIELDKWFEGDNTYRELSAYNKEGE